MKKFILCLIVVATASFISCSSDDDGGSQDPIVSKWQLEEIFSNGVANTIDNCQKMNTIEFIKDGTFVSINNEEIAPGECNTSVQTVTGTWSHKGNSTYNLASEFGSGDVLLTVENDKLTYLESSEGGGVSSESLVYNKVN